TFSVVAEGTEPFIYQWYKDAVPLSNSDRISGVTEQTLTIRSVTMADAGLYHVTVLNPVDALASSQAQLSIFEALPPTILTQPEGVTLGVGDSSTLSAVVDGSAPFSYQWLKDGTALSGERSLALELTNVTQDDSGEYQLRISNEAGMVTSDVAEILVIETAIVPVFHKHPSDAFASPGETAEFLVQVGGAEPITLQWYKDDEPIDGETDTTLVITSADEAQSGEYWVTATNDFGSADSRSALLTVLGGDEALLYAVDASDAGLSLESSTGVPWVVASDVEGSDGIALRSASIGNGQSSVLTSYIVGPGTLLFRWKVSSEADFDFLQFRVDGVTQVSISGDIDWETRSWELEAGTHRIDWVYVKDRALSEGEDAGYLDRVFLGEGLEALSALTFFPGAEATGSGWLYAPGIGFLWGDGFRWAYHEHHGWWYLNEEGGSDFWAYDLGLGWVYIESATYPFMYSAERNAWLYYLDDSQSPRLFVNTINSQVIEIP
ncbi:MAG: immunoglobulin domain-containing protein, partial [Puniceicoccales bacterium]